ncbi:DnaJ C-terminal domain-containing protein [Ningiella sp. W23]|uniref:DnaJ C-terminal domain-containing protein n=1 Tax=Ningiella sp. W23 TaxID=3023715 RepID=UPI0037579295
MEFKDYYKIMGLERDATQNDIKSAYRKLSRKYHPDVSKASDAEERFKEIGEAYEVLKDPQKRSAYDQLGSNWDQNQGFQPPPGFKQDFEFDGGGFTDGDAAQFSDFFEQLFGQRRGAHGRGQSGHSHGGFHAHGQDTHAKVSIDIEDAYQGANKTLTLSHQKLGSDGRYSPDSRTLNVKIPKGVKQGQKIRLAGQGETGMGDGSPGDLYLEIQFNPHPRFSVEGKDVYVNLPVTPWEAALGDKINVPTPSGTVDLTIPKNSKTGQKMRLKSRGIPAKSPGDLFLVLNVVLPKADNDKAQKAYAAFKEALNFNPRQSMGV